MVVWGKYLFRKVGWGCALIGCAGNGVFLLIVQYDVQSFDGLSAVRITCASVQVIMRTGMGSTFIVATRIYCGGTEDLPYFPLLRSDDDGPDTLNPYGDARDIDEL